MSELLGFGCYQDLGARKQQEDYFATTEPSREIIFSHRGFLAVVADGMGGHSDGALASLTAVNAFLEEYDKKSTGEAIPEALQRSLLQANHALLAAIRAKGGNSDMGTTLLACVVQDSQLYWISVGDSRLYRFRPGKLDIISEDHSYGAELDAKLFAGQISAVQAESQASKRHMLTSYLGIEPIPKINLSRVPLDLRSGDQMLLCSDGLTNALSDMEILRCLSQPVPAQERCEEMGRRIRDKGDPRQDNVTLVLLETRLPDQPRRSATGRSWGGLGKAVAIALAALVAAALAAAYFWWSQPEEAPPPGQPETVRTTEAPAQPETSASPAAPESGEDAVAKSPAQDQPGPTEATPQAPPSTAPPVNQGDTPAVSQPAPSEKAGTQNQNRPGQDDARPGRMSVARAQEILRALGFYSGGIDDKSGPKTREAIREFQKQHKLKSTGELNRPTEDKLREEIAKQTQGRKEPKPPKSVETSEPVPESSAPAEQTDQQNPTQSDPKANAAEGQTGDQPGAAPADAAPGATSYQGEAAVPEPAAGPARTTWQDQAPGEDASEGGEGPEDQLETSPAETASDAQQPPEDPVATDPESPAPEPDGEAGGEQTEPAEPTEDPAPNNPLDGPSLR